VLAFLKSALAQLCVNDLVLPLAEDIYRRCSPDPPSVRELHGTLIMVLKRLCAPDELLGIPLTPRGDQTQASTYIIIDGLDEIPYGARRAAILRLLGVISNRQTYPHLHLLVSSRYERDIETILVNLPQWNSLMISQENVETDLDIYISSQMTQNPRLQAQPDNIRCEIREKLVRGAGGM